MRETTHLFIMSDSVFADINQKVKQLEEEIESQSKEIRAKRQVMTDLIDENYKLKQENKELKDRIDYLLDLVHSLFQE